MLTSLAISIVADKKGTKLSYNQKVFFSKNLCNFLKQNIGSTFFSYLASKKSYLK